MSKKMFFNCSNYIILNKQKLSLVQAGKNINNHFDVKNNSYDLNNLDSLSFNQKKTVLLIPYSQLFVESFVLPVQARDKIDEMIKVKFINQLSVAENDLYYSYYIDDNLMDNNIVVICFAVKRIVVDRVYNLLAEKDIKIKSILPLPLLFYIYHRQNSLSDFNYIYKSKVKREDYSQEKQAVLYLDRFSSQIIFIVFHSDGVYLRSGSSGNLDKELKRTMVFLKDYLKISKIDLFDSDSKIKGVSLVDKEGNNELNKDQFILKDQSLSIFNKLVISKFDIKMLNILPQLSDKKKKKKKRYKFAVVLLISIIIISNIISINSFFKIKKDKLSWNQEKLQELAPIFNQLQELENQININEVQLELYKNILENRKSYLPWFYELSKQLPDGVKINHLNFNGEKMVLLDGSAPSASIVMETLQDSELFDNLKFIGGIVIDSNMERFRIAGDIIDE